MPHDDLRVCQQRRKMLRIPLIIEDRRFHRCLHLGENPRRDGGGKMTEKQGFHMLPSPNSRWRPIVTFASAAARSREAALPRLGARARRGAPGPLVPSRSYGKPRPVPARVGRKTRVGLAIFTPGLLRGSRVNFWLE